MQATVGDTFSARSEAAGTPERVGRIAEVRGGAAEPRATLRLAPGHEAVNPPSPESAGEQRREGPRLSRRFLG